MIFSRNFGPSKYQFLSKIFLSEIMAECELYIFLCQSVSKMFLGKIIRKIYIIYFCETEKPLIFGDPIEFFDLQRYDVYHSLERLSITQGTQTY